MTASNTAPRRRQFAVLLAANVASLVLNIATVVLSTYVMAPQHVGAYRYAVTYYTAVATTIQLGIPYSASLLLAREDDPERMRSLITTVVRWLWWVSVGAGLLVCGVMAVAHQLGALSGTTLLLAAPFPVTLALQIGFTNLLNGAHAITDLAAQVALPPLLIFTGLLTAALISRPVSYPVALGIYVVAYLAVHVGTAARFRSRDRASRNDDLRHVFATFRSSGWPVYVATLFAAVISNVMALVLGGAIGMTDYATFALALTMSTPAQMVPATMGVILFRGNARSTHLPARTIAATGGLTLAALLVYQVALYVLVPLAFPDQYAGASAIAMLLSVGYSALGFGDFFNRFIGAHGRGRRLMWGSISAGTVNAVLSLALIGPWGVKGAVVGSLAGNLTYLIAMIVGYRMTTRELRAAAGDAT